MGLVHDREHLLGEGWFLGDQAAREMEGSFDGTQATDESSAPQEGKKGLEMFEVLAVAEACLDQARGLAICKGECPSGVLQLLFLLQNGLQTRLGMLNLGEYGGDAGRDLFIEGLDFLFQDIEGMRLGGASAKRRWS